MKMQEITSLPDKDLQEKLDSAQTQLVTLRLTHAVSPLENPAQIKLTRRDVARMKTVLRQRELNK